MRFTFEQMDAEGFREIESWRYPPPYDFYDGDVDPVLNPERHFAARDETGEIVGFLYFEERGPRLEFGRERYKPEFVQLSVAKFNDRARIVYERAGFRVVGEHNRTFARWGVVPFLDMEEAR